MLVSCMLGNTCMLLHFRFEHIDIQPSPQPVRMLLSKRRLSDLQTISTAQVAAGLAGKRTLCNCVSVHDM